CGASGRGGMFSAKQMRRGFSPLHHAAHGPLLPPFGSSGGRTCGSNPHGLVGRNSPSTMLRMVHCCHLLVRPGDEPAAAIPTGSWGGTPPPPCCAWSIAATFWFVPGTNLRQQSP